MLIFKAWLKRTCSSQPIATHCHWAGWRPHTAAHRSSASAVANGYRCKQRLGLEPLSLGLESTGLRL